MYMCVLGNFICVGVFLLYSLYNIIVMYFLRLYNLIRQGTFSEIEAFLAYNSILLT